MLSSKVFYDAEKKSSEMLWKEFGTGGWGRRVDPTKMEPTPWAKWGSRETVRDGLWGQSSPHSLYSFPSLEIWDRGLVKCPWLLKSNDKEWIFKCSSSTLVWETVFVKSCFNTEVVCRNLLSGIFRQEANIRWNHNVNSNRFLSDRWKGGSPSLWGRKFWKQIKWEISLKTSPFHIFKWNWIHFSKLCGFQMPPLNLQLLVCDS